MATYNEKITPVVATTRPEKAAYRRENQRNAIAQSHPMPTMAK